MKLFELVLIPAGVTYAKESFLIATSSSIIPYNLYGEGGPGEVHKIKHFDCYTKNLFHKQNVLLHEPNADFRFLQVSKVV